MKHGTPEYTRWSIAIAVVVIFALIPVLWIVSLSFKTAARRSPTAASSRRSARSTTTRRCSRAASTARCCGR